MRVRAFGQRGLVACATAFAVSFVGLTGHANAQFPQLIPTRIGLVRFGGGPAVGRMYKFVSKAPRGGPLFQLPSSSPATTGGSLKVTIGSGTLGCTLAPGLFNGTVGWKELGNPAGSKGYKYLNKNAPTTDPCKVVIVKEKALKVIAIGTGTIAAPMDYPPGSPDISTVLTLGGDDYCGYAPQPHYREKADRYIKAKDEEGPGSCPSSCNCCSGGLDLLSFDTRIPSGNCGVLRNFRCSNNSSSACADDSDCDFGTCFVTPPLCSGDFGSFCSNDSDCQGTCGEVIASNLPLELACGSGYSGGGQNSIPLPITLPDRSRSYVQVTECDSLSGVLTLGPTTPSEVGARHCTSRRECSMSATPCVMDVDCPPTETCDTQCLFGAPVPTPNSGTPATSICIVYHIAEDVSGTAQCAGGSVNVDAEIRAVVYLNGDLFKSSTPPDLPGAQPCPLCDTLCQGGAKADFPCDDDTDCPGSTCNTSYECLGGPNDGDPCTPETSDSEALGDVENAYPTSQDCQNDPLSDVTSNIGGLPLFFTLTTGTDEWNAVDRQNGRRVFCGYCRDVSGNGSLAFEGDTTGGLPAAIPPADGNAVPCNSDADCDDGDEYDGCVQREPGAFSEAASTRISVAGSADGGCLADGQPHLADLVSIFCYPPTFDATTDAATDLPGPGAVMLQGEAMLTSPPTIITTTTATSVTTTTAHITTTTTTTLPPCDTTYPSCSGQCPPNELCVYSGGFCECITRFVDNGDGTITDNQTGLMWEKKDDAGGIHDKDRFYSWSTHSPSDPDGSAFTVFLPTLNDTCDGDESTPCTDDADCTGIGNGLCGHAGHRDWRLPSEDGCNSCYTGSPTWSCPCEPTELETILLEPYYCYTNPCVDPVFNTSCTVGCTVTDCSCTGVSLDYWSGSTNSSSPSDAWYVHFGAGHVLSGRKYRGKRVRAVRRGP